MAVRVPLLVPFPERVSSSPADQIVDIWRSYRTTGSAPLLVSCRPLLDVTDPAGARSTTTYVIPPYRRPPQPTDLHPNHFGRPRRPSGERRDRRRDASPDANG